MEEKDKGNMDILGSCTLHCISSGGRFEFWDIIYITCTYA